MDSIKAGLVAGALKDIAKVFPPPKVPKQKAKPAEKPLADEPAEKEPEPEKEPEKPKEEFFTPDPAHDSDGDGVADTARVGVPARETPPPPKIPRLPNLSSDERAMESKFAEAVEADGGEEAATAFLDVAKKNNYVFETDGAKALMPEWSRPDLPPDEKGKPIHPERAVARALYNTALHQTANAIAKKAFLMRLDEIEKLPEDQRKILVTSGGVAAGKGTALAADPKLAQGVAATWDAAGEQNATENPWVLEEAEKRGIKPVFLFVHNDPEKTWPGAVERAKGIGRMVDSKVFADSYAEGAKNFKNFFDKNKDRATFVIARAGKPPEFLTDVPSEALKLRANEVNKKALDYIDSKKGDLPEYIHQGATAGRRIWGE